MATKKRPLSSFRYDLEAHAQRVEREFNQDLLTDFRKKASPEEQSLFDAFGDSRVYDYFMRESRRKMLHPQPWPGSRSNPPTPGPVRRGF